MRHIEKSALILVTALAVGIASPAGAQTQRHEFHIEGGTLADALRAVGRETNTEIIFPSSATRGRRTPTLEGRYSAQEAVEALIAGSGLEAIAREGSILVRGRSDEGSEENQILVTGSRIRGSSSTAPVSKITAQDMRLAGQSNLGEAVRASPLNFGGGQNPGIGSTQGAANTNVNGASSVNLLGLGPSATLTLLNGSRLSYTSINAAVDISAIPSAAVDRVEIVPDGASAIYGADAVAGVVNVILRRDYNGAEIEGRIGGATDGGGFHRQVTGVVGRTWTGGSALGVYDFSANSEITASQRSYASTMGSDTTLYPELKRHSALVSIRQDISDTIGASLDALYKVTRQHVTQSFVTGRPHTFSGGAVSARNPSFVVAPTLTAQLGGDWEGRLISSYSSDRTNTSSRNYAGDALSSTSTRRYDNTSLSIEAGADGAILPVPAGSVRMAFGAGYRRSGLRYLTRTAGATAADFREHRSNRFAYGELSVPILSPDMASALGRSLTLHGAVRYEANSGTSSTFVPKVGAVYEPVGGIALKASWGRSYRLPTLEEQYAGYALVLLPTAGYGTGLPAGSTFMFLGGSNADLKPERSENWTVTAEFQPTALPGLTGSVGYFHFDYRDRIAAPVTALAGALSNPLYAELVTPAPTLPEQQDIIANADNRGLQNGTGGTYDPANVAAVLDARKRNVAGETYRGINASVHYTIGEKTGDRLDLSLDGVWMKSDRRLLPGAAPIDLAGTLFNPPKLKGRASAAYSTTRFTLAAYVNLASRITDTRPVGGYSIDGPRTVDLSGIFLAGRGLELGTSVTNLFNNRPQSIVTSSAYDTAFDSTNFSAIGRFISLRLRKVW